MIDIVRWAESAIELRNRHYDAAAGRWVLGTAPIRLSPHHSAILHRCFTADGAGRLPI